MNTETHSIDESECSQERCQIDSSYEDKNESESSGEKCTRKEMVQNFEASKPSNLNKISSNKNSQSFQKPKAVSESIWQRFKAIEKRTDDVTRRSTDNRIKAIQRKVIKKVQEEITDPDDIDILRDHDVKLGPPIDRGKRKRKKDALESKVEGSVSTECEEWSDVKQFLNVNEHLERPSKEAYKQKSGLEEKIDEAITEGNFEKAEELSNELSTRQFGTKIYGAISAKKFMEEKEREKESARAKRKKKLSWGFEAKERWETKGNL